MTPVPAGALRTFAFGDLGATVWGAVWFAPPGTAAFLALGADGDVDTAFGDLADENGDGGWEALSDQAKLSLAPAGPAVAAAAGDGFDQLCRVSGKFNLRGTEFRVDCPGVRTARSRPSDWERVDSIRAVSAWFDPAEGLALLALRPRGAAGQEQDQITASVLDLEGAAPVADPRLSTTYRGEGRPAHTGLELWLDDEGEEQAYPRRAAGERIGSVAAGVSGAFSVEAEPFRFHSRGRQGAGVYLLARRT